MIVAGGGVTGVMAAVAAAREGADVLLTEARGALGGVAMMGLPIQGYCGADGSQIVKGLAEEFRHRLVALGGALSHFTPCAMHNPYLTVDPEAVKLACQQMLLDAGVNLLLHAPAVNAIMQGRRIEAVVVEGKSGREALRAKTFVDCTGDADLATRSGAATRIAPQETLQASTILMTNVDTDVIKRYVGTEPERYTLFPLLSRAGGWLACALIAAATPAACPSAMHCAITREEAIASRVALIARPATSRFSTAGGRRHP